MIDSLREKNEQILRTAWPEGLALRNTPLIALALDPQLYSDETHQLISNLDEPIDGIPWLQALYGIRRFYEESNGMAYTAALGHNGFEQIEFIMKFSSQNLLKLQPHERIQAECWIVKSGPSSKITKGMRYLCDQLYHGFKDEDFEAALAALKVQPFADPGQLAAAKLYSEWFKASIQFLLTGEGDGWLTGLENHPIRERSRAPRWGIQTNGRNVAIGMEIRTRSDSVILSQGNLKKDFNTRNGSVIITIHELMDAGFTQGVIDTTAGKTEFPNLDAISFACESKSGVFHPFIDINETDEPPARQARSILAVVPASSKSNFRLGDHDVPCVTQAITKIEGYRLARLDFSNIDRNEVLSLSQNDSDPLIMIGAAPWLTPVSGEQDFRTDHYRDAWVVFGSETEILVGGITENYERVEWRDLERSDDGRVFLRRGKNHPWGIKKVASIKVPGRSYPVSVAVIFLPVELKETILSGNEWNHTDLRWMPERDAEITRLTAESTGLCSGVIHAGNVSKTLLYPSHSFRFWNYQGVKSIGESDQLASFSSLDECRYFRTDFYVPEGQHQVEWDGRKVLQVDGHGFFRLYFHEYGSTEPATSDRERLLIMRLHDGTQVTIMSCDASPWIKHSDKAPLLVLPKSAKVENWNYAILQEGIRGVRMLAQGSCVDLTPVEIEIPQIRSLGDHHISSDLGAAIMLWTSPLDFDALIHAPQRLSGVHLPILIHRGNPFLSSEGLAIVLDDACEQELLMPSWIGSVFEERTVHESWEESSTLIRGLEIVHRGDYPDVTWVPTAAFHLCLPDGSSAPIQTLGGNRLQTQSGKYRLIFDRLAPITVWCPRSMATLPFEWVLSPDDCDWDAHEDTIIPVTWQNGAESVLEIFYKCLDEAMPFIGSIEDGRLAWLFDYMSIWLSSEDFQPGRQILFQIAVIDRLKSLLNEANFLDGCGQDIVNGVKAQAYACSELWKCLVGDFVTVEWLLHWFRERSHTCTGLAGQMDSPFPTEKHVNQLFAWKDENISPWFADPEFFAHTPRGSYSFIEMLLEVLDSHPSAKRAQPLELETTRLLLSAMLAIARREKPESIWLPTNWFKHAGDAAGWIFNQNPKYSRIDFNVPIEFVNIPCLTNAAAIRNHFDLSMDSSNALLGNKDKNTHLAFVYHCLSSWFDLRKPVVPGRLALFHLAVLCRLRAWRVIPTETGLDFCIQASCHEAWKDISLRKILIADLLTIEWTLHRLGRPV